MIMIVLLLFPAGMALAAASDRLTMKIPNALVLALAGAFIPVALLAQMPLELLGLHLLCGLAVLAGGFALFALGAIGGGDAKFAAATALWIGFGAATPFLVYAALLGGGLTLLILGLRQVPLTPFIARHDWLARLHDRKSGVPYGIALALAGLLIYPQSPTFMALAQ